MSNTTGGGGGGGGGGDVTGPVSSTDNALVRFDGITGKIIKDGVAIEDDDGSIFSQDGTAAKPTYSFLNAPDTGMFCNPGFTLGWAIGGIPYLTLSSGGELGVGGSLNVSNSASFNGAISTFPVLTATDYNVLGTNSQIIVTDTSAPRTVTLQNSTTTGRRIGIMDGSLAAGTNNITIDGNGKLINGSATAVINVNGGAMTLMYDGTNYLIVG